MLFLPANGIQGINEKHKSIQNDNIKKHRKQSRDNVSLYKNVHHPFSALPVTIGNILALLSNECPGIFSS